MDDMVSTTSTNGSNGSSYITAHTLKESSGIESRTIHMVYKR